MRLETMVTEQYDVRTWMAGRIGGSQRVERVQNLDGQVFGALYDDEESRFGRGHLRLELTPQLQPLDARCTRGVDAEVGEHQLEQLGGVARRAVEPRERETSARCAQRRGRQRALADAGRSAQENDGGRGRK